MDWSKAGVEVSGFPCKPCPDGRYECSAMSSRDVTSFAIAQTIQRSLKWWAGAASPTGLASTLDVFFQVSRMGATGKGKQEGKQERFVASSM